MMEFNLGPRLASDNQKDYILTLLAEIQEQGIYIDEPSEEEIEDMLMQEASELIDDLKDLLGWS